MDYYVPSEKKLYPCTLFDVVISGDIFTNLERRLDVCHGVYNRQDPRSVCHQRISLLRMPSYVEENHHFLDGGTRTAKKAILR